MFLAKLAEKVEPEPASGLLTDTVRPSGVRSVTQKPGFLNHAQKHSILKMQNYREKQVPSSKVFCHPPLFLAKWQNTPRGLSVTKSQIPAYLFTRGGSGW